MKQLLRFEPNGAYTPTSGLEAREVTSLAPALDRLRGEFCENAVGNAQTSSDSELCQSYGAAFYLMPELLLQDYLRLRHESELGQILAVTKAMMADVDRVVILGTAGDYLGIRALLDACCQPYFNELSRGERGSRPRIYFEGNSLDSDAMQGLLHLLGAPRGHPSAGVEDSWSIVAISSSSECVETHIALRQFASALATSCGGNDALFGKRMIRIEGDGVGIQHHDSPNAAGVFAVPPNVSRRFSILSAVGLVPAALMGINVMKLLEGAAAMNEHFRVAPPASNVVLQFAAINHLLEAKGLATIRVMDVWNKSLESAAKWYEYLLAMSLGKNLRGATPLTVVGSRDERYRIRQHVEGRRDKIIHNVFVEASRFDALPQIGLSEDEDKTPILLHECLAEQIQSAQLALYSSGRPSTNLVLPRVDEYYLGQYFQMLMLATVIECKLLGIDPYE